MKQPSRPSTDDGSSDARRGHYGEALARLANAVGGRLRGAASQPPRLRDMSKAKAEVLISGDTAQALRAWMRDANSD